MKKILKQNKYVTNKGYLIRTITGSDDGGIFYYIAIYGSDPSCIIEHYKYRNPALANQKYRECQSKYSKAKTWAPKLDLQKAASATALEENKKQKSVVKEDTLPFVNETLRNGILCNDTHLHEKRADVVKFYKENTDPDERASHLQSIYNDDFTEFIVNKQRVGYKKHEKGLHIWEGAFLSRIAENFISWNILQAYISNLIKRNIYVVSQPGMEKSKKEKKAAPVQQISLFDTSSPKEPKNTAPVNISDDVPTQCSLAISIPQDHLEEILRTGGGLRNSRERIYAKYQQDLTPEEMTEFLKNEYAELGKGFTFGKFQKIAVWFNGNGMYASYGDYTDLTTAFHLSWAEIEKEIRKMVYNGTYMAETEVETIKSIELERIGNMLVSFLRELEDNYFQTVLPDIYSLSFPDMLSAITEKMDTSDGLDEIISIVETISTKLENNELKLRYKLYYSHLPIIQKELGLLRKEWRKFPICNEKDLTIKQEDFITQNEIDYVLLDGGNVEGSAKRIYNHFQKGLSQKENIEFLKNEYGWGGSSSGLPGRSNSWKFYSYKGLELIKNDLLEPEVKLLLPYNKIEKRFRELFKNIRMENPEKTEKLDTQESQGAHEVSEPVEAPAEAPIEAPANNSPVVTANKTNLVNFHQTYSMENPTFLPKSKYRQNIEAIKTLLRIENEDRYATPEEQDILAKYVGWGGLADVFDATKTSWSSEYQELKGLLSETEYEEAKASVLNAHYTSPIIIKYIYKALERFGFRTGNILEPSMGIGNFFSVLPDSMKDSKLYGVEIDSISGRIARLLYPLANIQICGFEETSFPNNFFDVAIGNVPFGDYKVNDPDYNRHNFLIHDYFFAKTLDKVRPGGVIAFITSKGTMDKRNDAFRKYIGSKARLLGAVRLPNTAFKANANTEVTADILFLQKRDFPSLVTPSWASLSNTSDGIEVNSYFVENPVMVLGQLQTISGPYGSQVTCMPDPETSLSTLLYNAINRIDGIITEIELDEDFEDQKEEYIPADPNVKDFSFTLVKNRHTGKNDVYFREGSKMYPLKTSKTAELRVREMIKIRDVVYNLIDAQMLDKPEAVIKQLQKELNTLYDKFTSDYGLITSFGNRRAFENDNSYPVLAALEILDDDGNCSKADIFYKRTINPPKVITSVDTAVEALAVSMNEKSKVDMGYMKSLTGKTEEAIMQELTGLVFVNPITNNLEPADEYLSGDVVDKLLIAKKIAAENTKFQANVEALEKVQPTKLTASEIEVRLGATWIEPKYIDDFMRDVCKTSATLLGDIIFTTYNEFSGTWKINGKDSDMGNPVTENTFGTSRRNGYSLLESCLNLKDVKIYDVVTQADGSDKRVINPKETMLANTKQEAIRAAFKNWIFSDPKRRQELCDKYNSMFNTRRPRVFDGSHLQFHGMAKDIELRPHQKNAVARILYGNNTLLAHCVGAGKTFEMVAAAMELKYLGLCSKSMFVVPNHLTEQWASEFVRLYPGAKILATRQKDFEKKNRQRFCSRIATGDYDAIIIGHSQFEKIPISIERQAEMIQRQITELELSLLDLQKNRDSYFSVKQMEKTKKKLQEHLKELHESSKKDKMITFEQLGVDQLFVDESHNYKNLFLYTKMTNIAGIPQTEAKKSSDMYAKCQYIDELTGGRGITFATGTPLSNSMTELYTNMRYLQSSLLRKLHLMHFDSWASSFGETQTVVELTPEGTGYQTKTRFSRFYNLPELISLFKECADIQTASMLNLPRPKAEYVNVLLKPSEEQKRFVAELGERAEAVRKGSVSMSEDNMLKITSDGRKLALDQRLINDYYPDVENSKTNSCMENILKIWKETADQHGTQLVFCDLSTPKDNTFNIYHDIRNKLIDHGVPENEIAFIHDANTDVKKKKLFSKVRSGSVRILLGSTAKMGAGTNVQNKLVALHHLDVPWRPSDLEQREGRILRQGNENASVKILRYVTENTFDSYSWQIIENKQRFISQIMTDKSPVRSAEDIDEATLNYAEVKALSTGNPLIKEKMDLDVQVSKLRLLKNSYNTNRYHLEDAVSFDYPQKISQLEKTIVGYKADISRFQENDTGFENFCITIGNQSCTDRKEAGSMVKAHLSVAIKQEYDFLQPLTIGKFMGFELQVMNNGYSSYMILKGSLSYKIGFSPSHVDTMISLYSTLSTLPNELKSANKTLAYYKEQIENAKIELKKPFEHDAELKEKEARLAELNVLLNVGDVHTAAL